MPGLVCTRSPGVACLPRITGLAPTAYFNMSSSSEDGTVDPADILLEQTWPDFCKELNEPITQRLEWHRTFLAAIILRIQGQSSDESWRTASEQHGNEPNPNGGTTHGTKKRNRSGGFKRSRRIRLLRIQCEHPDPLPSDEALLAKARKARSKATRNASSLRSTLRKGMA